VRFVLHDPWPDFMTFYGTTATAAGIVVPKQYLGPIRKVMNTVNLVAHID
jgi:hypothetical protein